MGIEPVIAPLVLFPSHCPCAFVATWEWNFTHSIYWTHTRFTLSIIYSSQQLYTLSGILLISKWSLKKLSILSRLPRGFPGGAVVKESTSQAGDVGLIPEWGRSPGEGNGNPLQYSCLENAMDRGAWWAVVHGVTKSRTWLSVRAHTHPARSQDLDHGRSPEFKSESKGLGESKCVTMFENYW